MKPYTFSLFLLPKKKIFLLDRQRESAQKKRRRE